MSIWSHLEYNRLTKESGQGCPLNCPLKCSLLISQRLWLLISGLGAIIDSWVIIEMIDVAGAIIQNQIGLELILWIVTDLEF